ncbi:hypothetical protein ABT186_38210 [Streptomyces sp. NPDC001634]
MSNWGTDGWAVAPGKGVRVELGGNHRPEVIVPPDWETKRLPARQMHSEG